MIANKILIEDYLPENNAAILYQSFNCFILCIKEDSIGCEAES